MSFPKLLVFAVTAGLLVLVFSAKVKVDNIKPQAAPVQSTPKKAGVSENQLKELAEAVTPAAGVEVEITWGKIGKKLVSAGAIDLEKYEKNYSAPQFAGLMDYLTDDKKESIVINKNNSYFWVNTLWALGLAQKSAVLTETKANYPKDIGNLAGTGGWTLGAKDAMVIYNTSEIIPLTPEQQEKVKEMSKNIFRPCCDNPTSFPDCNHGMAALGLLEIMVSQNFTEEEIYRAVLAFNSYWFSQAYTELAYYFQKNLNTEWKDVDAKRVLSAEFSSLSGSKKTKERIGNLPSLGGAGGACGA